MSSFTVKWVMEKLSVQSLLDFELGAIGQLISKWGDSACALSNPSTYLLED